MPAGIVEVTGDLGDQLDQLRKRGENTSPVMHTIAEMFVARVDEEYETAGHGKWQRLAESTLKKRRKGGVGAQPLKDTGRAAASTRAEWSDTTAEASTDVGYLAYHCSDAPRSVIPLRNPFDIPEDAFDEATDLLLAFVVGV